MKSRFDYRLILVFLGILKNLGLVIIFQYNKIWNSKIKYSFIFQTRFEFDIMQNICLYSFEYIIVIIILIFIFVIFGILNLLIYILVRL